MKKIILTLCTAVAMSPVVSQGLFKDSKFFIDFGPKVSVGPSWFSNNVSTSFNATESTPYLHKLNSMRLNVGGKFAFDFNDNFAIGYIPAGTANLLQAELSITKKVYNICDVLTSNNYKQSNLIKINENYFFLMAGIGWDAKIVHSIDTRIKKILGKIIFGLKGFQHFLFMDNNKLNVSFEGQNHQADWILSSNTKYYAGHHKINKSNIFDGKLVTYIFKDLTRLKLIYYIVLIIIYGDLSKNKSVITTYSKNIHIDGNNFEIPVQIDGDNFGCHKQIDIEFSDKKVNFLI
jgi:diacylglycerol kinase family enzyme